MKKPSGKQVTEDFWRDCLDAQDSKQFSELLSYTQYTNTHYYGRNNNSNKNKFNNNYQNSINIKSQYNKRKNKNNIKGRTHDKTIDNNNLKKIYKNHPLLEENVKTNKIERDIELRKKNAMMRCLGLYAYGVEVKKQKFLNDENNKKERIKDEISPCTFRPKLCKYSKPKQVKYPVYYKNRKKPKNDNNITSNGDYKIHGTNNSYDNGVTKKDNIKVKNKNKTIVNDNEDANYLEECTFKPKITKRNMRKIFDKSNSMANEKDNAEFFIRYAKAREEYMIKKFKKLSMKDDSYDSTLLSLASRFNNKQYKNGLNDLYDTKNQKNKKKINISINDYKDFENAKPIIDKDIINNLRNDLLTFDINEEE